MPYIRTKELLVHATSNRYGVASVNTFNSETIKWVIKAAERERVPVIVQMYHGFGSFIPTHINVMVAKEMAKAASVPVAIHLDHSETFEIAIGGIRDGFPSIMVDGSKLPFEENVEVTSAVVRAARAMGVEVEAELGHVGWNTAGDSLTDPVQAADFVKQTDCDFLAIAVGNAHGAYTQVPNLDFDRIKAIRKAVCVPLVMHGTSDIPDEQVMESVNLGMSKYNIFTEYIRSMYQSVAADIAGKESDNYFSLVKALEEPAIEFMRTKLRALNPNGYKV